MRSPNYYRVRSAVRVAFWAALVAGLLLGVHALDTHSKIKSCGPTDIGWACTSEWK